jgi:DNA gyrase subunit A
MSQTLELIKDYLTKYATYVNQIRANVALDGFKAVQRRIYFVTYKLARDKFIKTATISGNVIAYYHPHGESSVNEAIVGMVRNKWLIGQGNWGSRCTLEEIRPAAPRYTEVKFNDNLKWTMELIEFAEYTLSDLDYEEPLLLPTPIPIGLIGDLTDYPQNQQGIGVGIRTFVPMYRFADLVKLVAHVVLNEDLDKYPEPFVGSYAKIIKGDIEEILFNGNGSITIEPEYTIEGKSLILYHLTNKNLLRILQPYKDKLNVKDLSSANKTYVVIEPKAYARIDFSSIAQEIISKMRETQTFSIYVSIPNESKQFIVYKMGVLLWIKLQFLYYIECRKRFIQKRIDVITQQITELKLIQELRPYLISYLQRTKKPSVQDFLSYLPNAFDKTIVQNLLKKYPIQKLLTVDTDTSQLQQDLNQWKSKLNRVLEDSVLMLKQLAKVS